MRRAARVWVWALAGIAAVPILVAALVVAIANTDPGRRMVERVVAQASGGEVLLEGLAGRFPDRLHVARIELRDREGTWAVASDLALDWSPTRLLRLQAHVAHIELASLALHRPPLSDDEPAAERKEPTRLPLRIDVDALRIATLELAPSIAGVASEVHVRAAAHFVSASQFDLALDVERLDATGKYEVKASADASQLTAHVDLGEPAGGLLAQLAGLPDLGALAVKASLDGPRNAQRLRLVMSAGSAQATAHGTVDLEGRALDLRVAATAPAMRPSAGWHGRARLEGYVKGPYASPDANVELGIRGVEVGEAGFRDLEAKLTGTAGAMALVASVEGLRVPGARPDLFATAPLRLQANAPGRSGPAGRFCAQASACYRGRTRRRRTEWNGHCHDPRPRSVRRSGRYGIDGQTTIALRLSTKDDATRVNVDGALALTGSNTRWRRCSERRRSSGCLLCCVGAKRGSNVYSSMVAPQLYRRAVRGVVRRWISSGKALSDLGALAPALKGSLSIEGQVRGTPRELSLEARARGPVGAYDFALKPSRHVSAKGRLRRPPVRFALEGACSALRSSSRPSCGMSKMGRCVSLLIGPIGRARTPKARSPSSAPTACRAAASRCA